MNSRIRRLAEMKLGKKFVTAEEKERRKQKVLKHKFSEK